MQVSPRVYAMPKDIQCPVFIQKTVGRNRQFLTKAQIIIIMSLRGHFIRQITITSSSVYSIAIKYSTHVFCMLLIKNVALNSVKLKKIS